MVEVVVRHQTISLSRSNDGVKRSTGVCSISSVAEQLVFTTNSEGFDGSFGSVVVDIKVTIFNITNKFGPLVQAVSKGFPHRCFRRHFAYGCV